MKITFLLACLCLSSCCHPHYYHGYWTGDMKDYHPGQNYIYLPPGEPSTNNLLEMHRNP